MISQDDKDPIKIKKNEGNTKEISKEPSGDAKSIFLLIAVFVGVLVLFLGGAQVYNYFTSTEIINIDDMHKENLENNLDEDEGYLYNGYSFVYVDGLWWTEIQKKDRIIKIPLHFGPKEVENLEIKGNFNAKQFNKKNKVYIASDPNVISGHYVVAMKELSSNIAQGGGKSTEGACTINHTGCEDRKILNCNNANNLAVIELAISEEPKISLQGSCIKIEGQGYDLIKAADRLVLQLYGVMS